MGPLVPWIVWFQKFRISHHLFQVLLVRDDIHLLPVVFVPIDWSLWFWILVQEAELSPIRACSHQTLVLFSKALATWWGRWGGWWEVCPLIHNDTPCRITNMTWGDSMLYFPHSMRIFWSLSHVLSPFLHGNVWSESSVGCPQSLGNYGIFCVPLFSIS